MNLSETVRNSIRKDRIAFDLRRTIKLEAGYGQDLSEIFTGNVQLARSMRQGSTVVTLIEAFDSGFAFTNSNFSQVYPENTTYQKIATDCIRSMEDVEIGAIGLRDELGERTLRGAPYFGNPVDVLNQICPGCFYIDSGKAFLLGRKEIISGITNIDDSSGILNTPIREEVIVEVDIIFEPKIRVGQLVNLKSRTNKNVNGQLKVNGVRHSGMISESVGGSVVTSLKLLSDSPFNIVGGAI